ncbi:alpha-tocopherol transfer protein-like isoform X1 [Bombyx mandarina]|uniref:Alpha-tocopherol transfer protein-like isoform X1 n=1 Tax=Bombyx mandarina TaxID=7092 RepID=A0A6J2JVC5_BOMMA|nr:alpha-tocopherol transfer protein-like isoform X1 [Bombyx mandarina]
MAIEAISVQYEYKKHVNIRQEMVENLREWIRKQPHLPAEFITDLDIILAFHCCEYDTERTKHLIDLNFTVRTLFSFYQNREVNECIEKALDTWLVTPLSTSTKKGYRPIYCQILDSDPNKFVYQDAVRAFTMIVDLWQYEEGTVPGIVIILNMKDVSLGHISQIDLIVARQFFYYLQEGMIVKLKEFHFINAPSHMDKLMMMIRPLMKDTFLNVIKVHEAGSKTIEEYFPIAALPEESTGIILKENILKKLKANRQFFEDESKKRVNEAKRPGGPKTISSFFSNVETSFKKLEID